MRHHATRPRPSREIPRAGENRLSDSAEKERPFLPLFFWWLSSLPLSAHVLGECARGFVLYGEPIMNNDQVAPIRSFAVGLPWIERYCKLLGSPSRSLPLFSLRFVHVNAPVVARKRKQSEKNENDWTMCFFAEERSGKWGVKRKKRKEMRTRRAHYNRSLKGNNWNMRGRRWDAPNLWEMKQNASRKVFTRDWKTN